MEQPTEATEDLDVPPTTRSPSPIEIGGLIAALLPFLISVSRTSWSTVDGVTTAVHRDSIAQLGGAIAIACGIISAVALRRTEPARRLRRIGTFALLFVLGAVQLLRGFGMVGVGSPPPPPSGMQIIKIGAPPPPDLK